MKSESELAKLNFVSAFQSCTSVDEETIDVRAIQTPPVFEVPGVVHVVKERVVTAHRDVVEEQPTVVGPTNVNVVSIESPDFSGLRPPQDYQSGVSWSQVPDTRHGCKLRGRSVRGQLSSRVNPAGEVTTVSADDRLALVAADSAVHGPSFLTLK
jgi:hypothetical protein